MQKQDKAFRSFLHYLILVGAIALGAFLRFWNLDLKPLWLDEVITALFSLGRNYNSVPLEVLFSVDDLRQIFSFQPATSCTQIAQTLANQSTHPPLFFCLMHSWWSWVNPISPNWSWTLRSLPAGFGICAIAAIYYLNRVAFSPRAGLMAAGLMAVSPYAVYLSQEARHYTLPLLLITLSLVGLILIQQELFDQQQVRFKVWLGWAIANIIGLYVHYFFILAFIAELITLLGLMYWQRRTLPRHSWLAIGITITGIFVSFIPWLPVMLSHFNRSETSWLPPPLNIAPLYQTVISWLLMVIALPVENQPLWIAIPAGILMGLFGIYIALLTLKRLKQLWYSSHKLSLITFVSFTVCILIQFFVITYLLGKDITFVPRYHFVYYPSFCALFAASLIQDNREKVIKDKKINSPLFSPLVFSYFILIIGILSCIFVTSDLAFQKPYNPQQVAQNINQEPAVPLMVVMGYQDSQDVALGLSFALALEKMRNQSTSEFAFFKRSPGYELIWQKLSKLPTTSSQLNLWVVAPGLRRRDYPHDLTLSQQNCQIDPTQHYRLGIPYQLYRCN